MTQSRDPHLAHHFETPRQQFESGRLGMWIFLSTEILLFGGLFCAYAVYRANHPEIFIWAHRFLDKGLGGFNTLVLIGSSFTMAWAVRAAQLGERRRLITLLTVTLVLATVFLGVKAVEYEHKWKHGLLWGKRYRPAAHAVVGAATEDGGGAAASDAAPRAAEAPRAEGPAFPLAAEGPRGLAGPGTAIDAHTEPGAGPRNVQIFFGIYFLMTGLHALHVLAGMGAIGWVLARAVKGAFGPAYFAPVDAVGLYWHLVDIIWIYLFPLLYLIH